MDDDGAGDGDLDRTVAAAQAGDPRAFEVLVRRFREPLAAYAFALLRDRGLAEDATQEALLMAYREIRNLRRPARFRAWLYTILENAALSGWRRRRRRRAAPLDDGQAVAEGAPFPGEEQPRPEVLAVREALGRLPAPYVEILLLHYVEGLSATEAADALGLSRNNGKMRLHRARRALRRDLAAQGVTGAGCGAGAPREAAP